MTGDGEIYDQIDPKDSFKWGLMGGVLLGDYGNAEVGFMLGQQMSQLQAERHDRHSTSAT